MKTNTFEFRRVRIQDGVFRNFTGVVQDVNEERHSLTVLVTLFGRDVVIELPVGHVRQID